jgi:hypothetical protein
MPQKPERQMLNRKQLPLVARLDSKYHYNVDEVLNHLKSNNLLNFDNYLDIKYSANSKHAAFVLANQYSKNTFFKEDDAESLEGDQYRQLYLTDIDQKHLDQAFNDSHKTIFSRTKRLNPNSSNYHPAADELLYNKRNEYVKGPLEAILDMFGPEVKRVRFAVVMPGFSIKPHIDYDPSYITRIHYPLITNDKAHIGFIKKNQEERYHIKADGHFYFLNTGVKHWAENFGNNPRLHLIIDIHNQDCLQNHCPLDR